MSYGRNKGELQISLTYRIYNVKEFGH